jgi:anti-sigma factor RsiW
LLPLLSAYADGEVDEIGARAVREHLRACAPCRATMRSYRSTPATVAALTPILPASRTLLERAHELLTGLHSRLPGMGAGTGDAGLAGAAAAGGTRGAGMAALAKALAICAGTVGGAAACVATGVAPAPLGIGPQQDTGAKVERVSRQAVEEVTGAPVEYTPAPPAPEAPPTRAEPKPSTTGEERDVAEATEAGAIEYSPPPEPVTPPPAAEPSGSPSGDAAGEFGP